MARSCITSVDVDVDVEGSVDGLIKELFQYSSSHKETTKFLDKLSQTVSTEYEASANGSISCHSVEEVFCIVFKENGSS